VVFDVKSDTRNSNTESEQVLSIWQLVILVLSVLVLFLLLVETIFILNPDTANLFRLIDTSVCLIFLGDFFYKLFTSKNYLGYLKWGWFDLVSSIPMVGVLRIGRLVRVARIIRVIRAVRAGGSVLNFLSKHRTKNTLLSVVGGTIVLVMISSLAIINFEDLPSDQALWWSIYTLLTGELGDYLPSSIEGKIITMLLMTAGVALFGTFTASVASFFFQPDQAEDERRDEEILSEIKKLSKKIDIIEAKFDSTNSKTN